MKGVQRCCFAQLGILKCVYGAKRRLTIAAATQSSAMVECVLRRDQAAGEVMRVADGGVPLLGCDESDGEEEGVT